MRARFEPLTRLVGAEGGHAHGAGAPAHDDHGAARFYAFQAELSARYAASDRLELFFAFPYRALTLRAEVQDAHHRNETMHGPGDARLGVRWFLVSGERVVASATAGLALPTGRRNPIDRLAFVDHDEAARLGVTVRDHSHLQLGRGVVAALVGADLLLRLSRRWLLFAAASAAMPLDRYRDGYLTAPTGRVLAGPAATLASRRLLLTILGEVTFAGRDRLDAPPVASLSGEIEVPNSGRVELALAPAAVVRVSAAVRLDLRLRIPVFTAIAGGGAQLTAPVGVSLGLAYDVALGGG